MLLAGKLAASLSDSDAPCGRSLTRWRPKNLCGALYALQMPHTASGSVRDTARPERQARRHRIPVRTAASRRRASHGFAETYPIGRVPSPTSRTSP
jgi:hypothetical protein